MPTESLVSLLESPSGNWPPRLVPVVPRAREARTCGPLDCACPQPRAEANAALQRVADRGVRSGLNDVERGLRLFR